MLTIGVPVPLALALAGVGLVTVVALFAAVLTWRAVSKGKLARSGSGAAAALAGKDAGLELAGGGVLMESFTLGWLNLLVRALWAPVLEKYVAVIAQKRLQSLLSGVSREPHARARACC